MLKRFEATISSPIPAGLKVTTGSDGVKITGTSNKSLEEAQTRILRLIWALEREAK